MEPTAAPSLFDFSVFGWPWTGLVTLLTLLVYMAFALKVARERKRHQVMAPVTTGPEPFMVAYRIHANTAEQLIIFLPLLWMAALSTSDGLAAVIGAFWPVSRIIYAIGYTAKPGKRLPGFAMGMLIVIVLFGLVAFEMGHAIFFWHDEGAPVGAAPNPDFSAN